MSLYKGETLIAGTQEIDYSYVSNLVNTLLKQVSANTKAYVEVSPSTAIARYVTIDNIDSEEDLANMVIPILSLSNGSGFGTLTINGTIGPYPLRTLSSDTIPEFTESLEANWVIQGQVYTVMYNSTDQTFDVQSPSINSISNINYNNLSGIPRLNTASVNSLPTDTDESISGTISLNQIAKTGKDKNGNTINGFNGRVSSLNFKPTEESIYGTIRNDICTQTITDSSRPSDGFVTTYFWDNSGRHDTQMFIPNQTSVRPRIRTHNDATDWQAWKELAYKSDVDKYAMRSTDNPSTAAYIKLGTITMGGQCKTSIINVYGGPGQNGRANQNSVDRVYIKIGYNNTIGITADRLSYPFGQKYVVIQKQWGTWDIYQYSPSPYSALRYTIEGDYQSWTHSGVAQKTEPTGTQVTVTHKTAAFRDDIFPIGAVYITVTNNNPSSYLGGTWVGFGGGRVLVGVNSAESEFNTPLKTGGVKSVNHKHGYGIKYAAFYSALYDDDNALIRLYNGDTGTYDKGVSNGESWSVTGNNGVQERRGSTFTASVIQNAKNTSGTAVSTIQPYITVYFWRRTA